MKKRVAWALILIVAIVASGWVATGQIRFRSSLTADASGSSGVVLERYYSGTALQTTKVPAQEISTRIEQFPAGLGRLRHTFSKCWVPHHRIRFDSQVVEICFTCDEIWTDPTGRRKIPEDWKEPLRELFTSHGIAATAPKSEEYLRHLDSIIEEAEQDAALKDQR